MSDSQPGPASPELRVLVVEDEPNNQVLLQKILTRMGLGWECVSDGASAIERAAAQDYDLILMDLSLPKVDGWDATRAIRAAGSNVPIIATSAHAMVGDRQKALDAGCTAYMAKPFNLTDLRAVIRNYVGETGEGSAHR